MNDNPERRLQDVEGEVKWFDPRKGYGFIIGPDGQDVFAHFSKIEGDGFRVLKDGSRVTYDAEHGEKGWQATRIVRLPDSEITVREKRGYARSPRR
ncbi:MAG: cold shock domain-containing protein [Phycisphaerales bacterium]|nr:MAG: cold shock domain-containing protein [Phycisphaerales bacterium]